jgi:hypothetical protein
MQALPKDFDECLKFIEEKLDEAVRNPQSQKGAITEASGAMVRIQQALFSAEYEYWRTIAALCCEQSIEENWQPWWSEFARFDREQFLERAYWLRRNVATLRYAIEQRRMEPIEEEK